MNKIDTAALTTVIVPHYNDLDRLDQCLAALEAQIPSKAGEIIVADNGSPCGPDRLEEVIAGRARLVIEAEQRGAAAARNAGVAAATSKFLAFTDSDCIPSPGWLAAGLSDLDRFDVVGGQMTVATASPGSRSGAEVFEAVFAFRNDRYVEHEGFTVTANLLCSRATFDAVGPFRGGLSEDMEWCERATSKGFTLGYCEGAMVAHPARKNWAELTQKWQRINREIALLKKKRGVSALGWKMQQFAVALSAIAHTPRLLTHHGLTLQERLRGLATLYAMRFWRARDSFGIDLNA